MMKNLFCAVLILASGCSIIPKPVEFGQKKVQKFPEHRDAQLEAERQAVALAAEKAREAEKIATADESDAAVPAGEAAGLSEAVSRSLGPPSEPWKKESQALTDRLDKLTAKYNRLLEKFADKNDEQAGKKIEGSGWFSVPYVLWIGILAAVVFIGYSVLKVVLTLAAASNPGVGIGLKVAQVGGRVLSRGFSQLVQGGENFEAWVEKEVTDLHLKDKILAAFKQNHTAAQDQDVQNLVKNLTKA